MMPLWNLRHRDGTAYHWDGLNTSLREVVQSSAIGDGATTRWMDRDYAKWNSTDPKAMSSLRRVMNYIGDLKAPRYPLPIDATLASAGAPTYKSLCASCHEAGGSRTGTVIPLAEVGTDRHRLDMWTEGATQAYNQYGKGHDWNFTKFRKTAGYTAVPLDGIWLTAPYLHNGSVPTLADLLEPPVTRPKTFWRGYDLYEPTRVGFRVRRPGGRTHRHALRRHAARQQQRRSHLWCRSPRGSEARAAGVSEDALTHVTLKVPQHLLAGE
jgi:hypothetical protein